MIRSEEDVCAAYSGDNIKLKLKGVEEEVCQNRVLFNLKDSTENDVFSFSLQDISSGFVLCGLSEPCHVGRVFDAQVGGGPILCVLLQLYDCPRHCADCHPGVQVNHLCRI